MKILFQMKTDKLKQQLIDELNENSFLHYAEIQKFKKNNLPKDLISKKLNSFKRQKKITLVMFGILGAFLIFTQFILIESENSHPFLQNLSLQFIPILGVLFFQANYQNIGKRIFILELLLNWDEN